MRRMPKFFTDKINNEVVEITGEDYSHIKVVLRYGNNEIINVCDGKGTDYKCVIREITNKSVFAEIIEAEKNKSEPDIMVTLFQSIPKADKMELIIMKSVELGVKRIVPVITYRSIGSYLGKEEKKLARFRRISESAAKQSGRGIIPEISFPVLLNESLVEAGGMDLLLTAYENEKKTTIKKELTSFVPNPGSRVGVYIGPEGGFTEEEVAIMRSAGARPITLGSRVLRAETAGPTAIALILYELEG